MLRREVVEPIADVTSKVVECDRLLLDVDHLRHLVLVLPTSLLLSIVLGYSGQINDCQVCGTVDLQHT